MDDGVEWRILAATSLRHMAGIRVEYQGLEFRLAVRLRSVTAEANLDDLRELL